MSRNRPYQISIQTTRTLVETFDAQLGHNRYGARSALFNAFMQDFIEGNFTPRVIATIQQYDQPSAAARKLLQHQADLSATAKRVGLD